MLSGGGSGGPVTPLLAVAQILLKSYSSIELVFVGGKDGPEKEMVANFSAEHGQLRFIALAAGKWRRYLAWQNFIDVFKIGAAFFKAWALLNRERPDLVISAGSFVSVPLVWAAYFKKIPVLIHQQDSRPGLANRLMAPCARVITVNFEKSLLDYGPRAICIGNPFIISDFGNRAEIVVAVRKKYGLHSAKPLIFLTGGRLGAQALNNLLWAERASLKDWEVIHLTGDGKSPAQGGEPIPDNYRLIEALPHDEVLELIIAADLVISRAGLGTLTELSFLNKPAIIIPIPHSHQEDNAAVFARARAAVVLEQKKISSADLLRAITMILSDDDRKQSLANNIGLIIRRGAAERLAGLIVEILSNK